jgi:uncharacterized membrane protein
VNERVRQALGFALLGVLFVALAVVYPPLVAAALERFGVRTVAAFAALAAAGGAALRLRFGHVLPDFPRSQPLGPGQSLGVLVLLGAAIATGQRSWLLLLPALAYAYLAWTFWMSLGGEVSIVQRAALVIQPRSPDFIAAYCRAVTALWAALFAVFALAIAGLAIAAPLEVWRAFTGPVAFALVSVLLAGEFLFRKWWFRHYEDHAFDRLLSRFMPAEETERGRRSVAFIRDMKARMQAERERGARR